MGQTVNLLSLDFGGSNPSSPTRQAYGDAGKPVPAVLPRNHLIIEGKVRERDRDKQSCGNSSVDRALAFQAEGRGFESRFPLQICRCYSSAGRAHPW